MRTVFCLREVFPTRSTPILHCASRATWRTFASKTKKDPTAKKEGTSKLQMTESEFVDVADISKFRQQLQRVIDELKAEFAQQLNLRTSIAAFDHLIVEADGKKYQLNTIAQISQRSPQLVALNMVATPQYIAAVKTAITSSGLNVNPQQDGTTIFIPLPKVTREHRENLAKSAKSMCDKAKVKLRDVQNKYIRDARKLKETQSADLIRAAEDKLHAVAHEYAIQADTIAKAKQEELLASN